MEKITPEEFKEIIRDFHKFENPPAVMVFGEPGIGKSYAAAEIAHELGRKYIPLSLGRLEAYDIKGMPDLSKDFMEWKPPIIWSDIIKEKGNVVLHFDEFTLADENVQGAVLDIVQMKKIDDIKLPDQTIIIISGNMGGDDGTFAKILTSALTGGRAAIFQMKKPTVPEWLEYQKPCAIIHEFLKFQERQLYRGPNTAEPFSPWTCPRSWSLFDSVIKKLQLDPRAEKKDRIKFIKYGRALLSEDTMNSLSDFVDNAQIDVKKLLEGDKLTIERFMTTDSFRQAGVIKEAARAEIKPKQSKKEALQALLNLILKRDMSRELIALFAEELVKTDPETLTKLMVNEIALDKWADKLTFELR
jgi:hypothetical protein